MVHSVPLRHFVLWVDWCDRFGRNSQSIWTSTAFVQCTTTVLYYALIHPIMLVLHVHLLRNEQGLATFCSALQLRKDHLGIFTQAPQLGFGQGIRRPAPSCGFSNSFWHLSHFIIPDSIAFTSFEMSRDLLGFGSALFGLTFLVATFPVATDKPQGVLTTLRTVYCWIFGRCIHRLGVGVGGMLTTVFSEQLWHLYAMPV